MRKLMLLLGGVVLGFVAAHFVNQSPEGRRFFDRVNRGMSEFSRAFASGYESEADESDLADDLEDALRDLRDKA
ncbi:hypothetical protein [Leucobacter chromiireducens]|uniref:YtxH domain-containing protein n=1 Tax=Leucobacter chromiireducens subsp. chromiireducens TaxID=660067 RepID=A0ABS1SS43_9MICO|nr:hypothetical protein [Leucobacter chromiireducens]MBL3690967.1 hypothetical protein [Leucobacter chromiireducens subsp. chromiireducens]